MSDQSLDTNNSATDAGASEGQVQATKTYTQEEFDNHMAGLKNSLTKKFSKQFEDLGDIDELRSLKQQAEAKKLDEAKKRGEFEKVLQELAAKKDAEISKRDSVIKEYKVNVPILSAAAKYNAVNADQVKALLATNVRLNDNGDVEVVDSKGSVRYNDKGEGLGVDDLVREFLDSNPHFKLANPTTTNSKSNIVSKGNAPIDVSKLDMNKPEHRALYREHRKTLGLQ